MTKIELDSFCEELDRLETVKKEAADDMKVLIENVAANNELDKKSLKKFYKEWKEYQKNKEEFVLVDYEADNLLQIACPEFSTAA